MRTVLLRSICLCALVFGPQAFATNSENAAAGRPTPTQEAAVSEGESGLTTAQLQSYGDTWLILQSLDVDQDGRISDSERQLQNSAGIADNG